jgi:oxygen-dependent protoporphyrinogen oxidase
MSPSPESITRADALVVGAGISGLSAALGLKERGLQVRLLEENDQPGGVVGTDHVDGYICERGPHTFMINRPEVESLLDRYGLLKTALEPGKAAKNRYVLRSWAPIPLPRSLLGAITSPVLDFSAKLRLLREPFVRKGTDPDETVADFFTRRCGFEFYRRVVNAFCNGIYAGDPRAMIMRHSLPKVWEWEQTHGSLFKGARKASAGRKVRPRIVSWPQGLGQLAEGLAAPLGDQITYRASVSRIARTADGWRVESSQGTFEAPRLVMATPAPVTALLLGDLAPGLNVLHHIRHAPLVLVHLGYKRKYIEHPLDGFGTLISRSQRLRALGVLFASTLFPGRTPKEGEEHVLLTTFLGGILDPGVLSLSDSELVESVMQNVGMFLGMRGMPYFSHIVRWTAAIPQYEADHDKVLAACTETEKQLPGLKLVGGYRDGVSLGDCLLSGHTAGQSL